MSLTVLSVAYPSARVGPDAVGGAEQIVSALDRALIAAGHRSVVVACEGSEVAGTLLSVPEVPGRIDAAVRSAVHERVRSIVDRAIEAGTDLVHLHGVDLFAYLPQRGAPLLATLHLPTAWYPPGTLGDEHPDLHFVCVSASQARTCPPLVRLLPAIGNGVQLPPLARHAVRKRGFAVALGRVCPEKGFHHALDAARSAGVPLLIGGQVFPYEAHERYFAEQIVPRLGGGSRFLGPVGGVRKRRLLAAARCLVVASMVEETSSLVGHGSDGERHAGGRVRERRTGGDRRARRDRLAGFAR